MPRPGEPYYVTTPIYYVNGEPHLGHAYTTIAADVATRHARRSGADAFLLTGTDEHGAKVAQAAAAGGALAEGVGRSDRARTSASSPATVEATNDFFIRTTDPEHEAFVQRFVERMRERGDLYESTYSGLYCTACEAFYTEDDLVDGRCPEHGTVPSSRGAQHVLPALRLQRSAARALRRRPAVRAAADAPQRGALVRRGRPPGRLDHARGGRPGASRCRGIPTRRSTSGSTRSSTTPRRSRTRGPGEDLTGRLWPARWQLLGKDILRFHAVIWPAMLLSAGYELPQQLFIHGMLAGQDGHRMSKTRGNAMDYRPAVELYGPDALRYYLLREVGFGQDGGVGYQGMHDRYHGELANELGNLVSRSIAMVRKYRGGVIPAVRPAPSCSRSRPRSPRPTTTASTCSTSPARWSTSGSSCARSTASSRRARRGCSPRATIPGPWPRSTRRWRRSARACARSPSCSGRSCPRAPR